MGKVLVPKGTNGTHWAGDAFTKDLEDIIKCIDDACMWAYNIDGAYKKVCDYLTLVGRNGIVLNPAKGLQLPQSVSRPVLFWDNYPHVPHQGVEACL